MTGSTPFSLEKSANFGRSFRKLVKALWIYNHDQFRKRPSDKDIEDAIQEIFNE